MSDWQQRQLLEQRAKKAEHEARRNPNERTQAKAKTYWKLFDNFRIVIAEKRTYETQSNTN